MMTRHQTSCRASRREFLAAASVTGLVGASCGPAVAGLENDRKHSGLRVSGLEVFHVHLPRGAKWVFVRLKTNYGISGIGEATLGGPDKLTELKSFFALVEGESPFDIQQYRMRGWNQAASGRLKMAAAFSAVEQALWDVVGKALKVPVFDLFGGKAREVIPLYANINNATTDRSPRDSLAMRARRSQTDSGQ